MQKKYKDNMEEIINIHLNGQTSLYVSNIIKKKDYDICYSNFIEDEYWNFAYLKNNKVSLETIFKEIKKEMVLLNKMPVIYITSNILNSEISKDIEKCNLKVSYTDVWMTFKDLEKFVHYKSKVDFKTCKVNNELKEPFIEAVMNGFSGENPEDPYETLSEGYKIGLNQSFSKDNNEYSIIHYLGRSNTESISTATVIYKKDKAILYNITTNKKYQKKGVCKQMMAEIVQDLIKLNINEICVQTEKNYYTEQVYKNMGFKEKLIGIAYIVEV